MYDFLLLTENQCPKPPPARGLVGGGEGGRGLGLGLVPMRGKSGLKGGPPPSLPLFLLLELGHLPMQAAPPLRSERRVPCGAASIHPLGLNATSLAAGVVRDEELKGPVTVHVLHRHPAHRPLPYSRAV